MDISFLNNHKKKLYFLTFIIILGLFLRIYNINFEDLWFDEQASFLVADPKLDINETILLVKNLDNGTSLFFNLILKKFFESHIEQDNYDKLKDGYVVLDTSSNICYFKKITFEKFRAK